MAHHGRPQPVRFIDWEHPENNDFLVINQFKVELTSGRGHVIPDDIAKLAHRVLRHRLILGFEAASASITPEVVVDAVLQAVRVP